VSIAALVLCVAGAFFFAGSETGFVSWNPLKVSYRARQGSLAARWALYLMRRKGRVVAAVLVGNNVCIVGATLAFLYLFTRIDEAVGFDLSRIPSPESWLLSPLLVVFGEMLPKSLYRIYSFKLTLRSIPLLMCAYWATLPLSWTLGSFGLPGRKSTPEEQTYRTRVREEMIMVASEGVRRGTLFENANVVIDGVLRLKDKTAADVAAEWGLSPATALTTSETILSVKQKLGAAHDAVVVVDPETRQPVGWISIAGIASAADGESVGSVMKALETVDGKMPLLSCLGSPGRSGGRFGKVVDENGMTVGLFDRQNVLKMAFKGLVPAKVA